MSFSRKLSDDIGLACHPSVNLLEPARQRSDNCRALPAAVAELVDALALGASWVTPVMVRVHSAAPIRKIDLSASAGVNLSLLSLFNFKRS